LLQKHKFVPRGTKKHPSSRYWGGSVRDDPNNGCEGDYSRDWNYKSTNAKKTWLFQRFFHPKAKSIQNPVR